LLQNGILHFVFTLSQSKTDFSERGLALTGLMVVARAISTVKFPFESY